MIQEKRYINREDARLTVAGRTVRGYAIVYNSWSNVLTEQTKDGPIAFREVIERGAFADAPKADVHALWQHDTRQPIGRTASGTMRLVEDEIGIRFEIDLPRSAEAALEAIERGDVTGMSFSAGVLGKWAKAGDLWTHTINRGELREISPVTWAAYPGTVISRSIPPVLLARAECRLLALAPRDGKR